jgi:hypothetical protein
MEEDRMKVSWGGNELTDCAALLAMQDKIMLQVLPSPVRVNFSLPTNPVTPVSIEIRDNRIVSSDSGEFHVSESPRAVAVMWKNVPILMAQQIGDDTVLLRTDLRPLGIGIFDDAAGLHIGSSVLSGNNFAGCSIGIALG